MKRVEIHYTDIARYAVDSMLIFFALISSLWQIQFPAIVIKKTGNSQIQNGKLLKIPTAPITNFKKNLHLILHSQNLRNSPFFRQQRNSIIISSKFQSLCT